MKTRMIFLSYYVDLITYLIALKKKKKKHNKKLSCSIKTRSPPLRIHRAAFHL